MSFKLSNCDSLEQCRLQDAKTQTGREIDTFLDFCYNYDSVWESFVVVVAIVMENGFHRRETVKIVEGKRAVLKPYRTERDCILPRQGQTALPLEPMVCPVREPQTVTCSSAALSDARIQVPKAGILRRVSEADMQKPVECITQEIPDVRMHSAMGSAVHVEDITINDLQTTEAQMIPATPDLEQMMEETEPKMSRLKKKKGFADKIFHITNSQ